MRANILFSCVWIKDFIFLMLLYLFIFVSYIWAKYTIYSLGKSKNERDPSSDFTIFLLTPSQNLACEHVCFNVNTQIYYYYKVKSIYFFLFISVKQSTLTCLHRLYGSLWTKTIVIIMFGWVKLPCLLLFRFGNKFYDIFFSFLCSSKYYWW